MTTHGRTTLKGRGGKFYQTMSLQDGQTEKKTKKNQHISHLRISDWSFIIYIFINLVLMKHHRRELVPEEMISCPTMLLITTKIATKKGLQLNWKGQ